MKNRRVVVISRLIRREYGYRDRILVISEFEQELVGECEVVCHQ